MCVVRDISERKRSAALREHHAHLEELVGQRTADLRTLVKAMAGREICHVQVCYFIRYPRPVAPAHRW